jgi:hypothetical protein
MPRPDSVTAEDLARWEINFENLEPPLFPEIKKLPWVKESCFAGDWAGEQLEALGCPDDVAAQIIFVSGRRCAVPGADPWASHMLGVEDYKKGLVNTNAPICVIAGNEVVYLHDGMASATSEESSGPHPSHPKV